jgi:aspartyl protease family protein
MWGQISQTVMPRQSFVGAEEVIVPRAPDGHYYLTLDVNETPIEFVIDTGASQIVLSQRDARSVGLDPSDLRFLGSANTANGVVQTAPVRLSTVALGPIIDQNVPAVVNGGQMDGSLLGMSYLSGFSGISIRNDELILTR